MCVCVYKCICMLRLRVSHACVCALLCRWMEACLDEELPPTTELEEGLRNGVYLAKLGNFFAPRTVSLKKIYDREQTRYKVIGHKVKKKTKKNPPAFFTVLLETPR